MSDQTNRSENTLDRRQFVGAAGAAAVAASISQSATAADRKTIGVGCIGVGNRGTTLLRELVKIEGVEVRAICDIRQDRLDQAEKTVTEAKQPKPFTTTKWSELLARSEVDAVVSAIPIDLHAQNYIDTLSAGKDLYGEKPLALSVQDCNGVIKAATKSGKIAQIGFQRRASPFFIDAMKVVHAGELGDLVEGRVCWSNSWGPLGDWFGKRERSGDWMIEQACHNWDVLNWSLKCLPKRAVGLGRDGLYKEFQADRTVTDYYSALLEYENGVIINVLHSWVAPGQPQNYPPAFNQEYTRVIGTKAGVDFNTGLISYRKELNKPDRSIEGSFDYSVVTKQALESFFTSVRTRSTPVATLETGRDATLVGLLVQKAVYERRMIDMKELVG